MYMGLN